MLILFLGGIAGIKQLLISLVGKNKVKVFVAKIDLCDLNGN